MKATSSITPFLVLKLLFLGASCLTHTPARVLQSPAPEPPFKISTKLEHKDTDDIFEIVETKVIEIGSALENAIPRITETIQTQQARLKKIKLVIRQSQAALTKAKAANDKKTTK
jgi:hypothetical protein